MQPQPEAPQTVAQRLWEAARLEFSLRGYRGARVQAIAQTAGCNVALIYRVWRSKEELYMAILRSIRQEVSSRIVAALGEGQESIRTVVAAYLDAMMRDPVAARIVVREIVDGGRFLSQLGELDPGLVQPVRHAAAKLAGASSISQLRPGLDPMLSVITVASVAALGASTQEATASYLGGDVAPEQVRRHLHDVLLHGLALPDDSTD